MTLAEIVAKSMRAFEEIFDSSISFFDTKHLYWLFQCHVIITGVMEFDIQSMFMLKCLLTVCLGFFTGPVRPNHCSCFSHSDQVVFNMCRVWRGLKFLPEWDFVSCHVYYIFFILDPQQTSLWVLQLDFKEKVGSSGIECNFLNSSVVDLFQSLQITTLFGFSFKFFPTLFYWWCGFYLFANPGFIVIPWHTYFLIWWSSLQPHPLLLDPTTFQPPQLQFALFELSLLSFYSLTSNQTDMSLLTSSVMLPVTFRPHLLLQGLFFFFFS